MLSTNNRLLLLAREGRRPPSAITAIALTFLTLAGCLVVAQIIWRAGLRPMTDATATTWRFAEGVSPFIAIALVVWFLLAGLLKRPFRTLGFERLHAVGKTVMGALVAVSMIGAVVVGLVMLPQTQVTAGVAEDMPSAASALALVALIGTTIQASAEELLFRGWLLQNVGSRYGARAGALVSAVSFGIAHALNPNASVLGIANLTLFGAFLALLALHQESLWGVCAWHTIWNWIESSLLGLSGSGGPPERGLVAWVKPAGPEWLTGGSFGPDGSVIQTLVLVAGIAVFLRHGRGRPSESARGGGCGAGDVVIVPGPPR